MILKINSDKKNNNNLLYL